MPLRVALLALVLVGLLAPAASAHDVQLTAADRWRTFDAHHGVGLQTSLSRAQAPLEGEGEGLELVGNLPIGEASDLELHGNLAFVGSYTEGMVIADISDPANPKRVGVFDCGGGSQYDIQLRPDGKVAALTTDGSGSKCHNGSQGTMIIDVSNPAAPRELAFLEIRNPPSSNGSAGSVVGSHTHTFDWPYLYINQYQSSYHRVEIFSLADPAKPAKVGEYDFGSGQPAFHDSYVDHRPDGRTLLYAGSDSANDVLDVTDPAKPRLLQRVVDPEVTFSHQNEPDFDRNTALVTDEYLGGAAGPSCGKADERGSAITPAVPGAGLGDPTDLGALHLYEIKPDGTMGKKLSTFNLPSQPNEDPQSGCTIHVFWQAPDQDRLVTAWYGKGVRILDYSDPTAVKELAHFIPSGTNMWAAKPHNGFIFTGDLNRGLDVLRYTGEGWPRTAGPAEVQRAAQQKSFQPDDPGAPAPGRGPEAAAAADANNPTATPPRRLQGLKVLKVRVRVPGRGSRRVVLRITNLKGRQIGSVRKSGRGGRRVRIAARVAGDPGRYRYRVTVGERTVKRGRFRVVGRPGVEVLVPGNRRVLTTPTGR